MKISPRLLALCLAAPLVSGVLTSAAAAPAAAAPSCEGSMNGGWAFNGICQGDAGTYRLEIDCFGYDFGSGAPIIGPYTARTDLPVGRAGTVSCFGPNWSSAGWGMNGRIFRL